MHFETLSEALNTVFGSHEVFIVAITITNQGIPLLQRGAVSGTGTARVAGTFTGSPTSISVIVKRVADDAIIVASTVIDASPTGGVYNATIGGIPESLADTYYLEVNAAGTGDTANTKGVWQFQVGRWICVWGQSNGLRMFSSGIGAPAASTGTYYRTTSFSAVPDSNGVRELLNGLVARFGVPWGCVQYCISATAITTWGSGGAAYIELASRVAAIGDIECQMWVHGESAAVDATAITAQSPPEYSTQLNTNHSDLAATVGRTVAQCPMIVNGLGREIVATYLPASWHRAMQCCWHAARQHTHIHLTHSCIDLPMAPADGIHWSAAGQGEHGKRAALGLAQIYGIVSGSAYWEVSSCTVSSPTSTTVVMTAPLSGDFTGVGSLSGFEVSSDGITWVTATGAKVNSSTISLTHTSLPYPNRAVRFCYGDNPDISNLPLETTLNSPPMPTMIWVTAPNATSGNPIFQVTAFSRSSNAQISIPDRNILSEPGKALILVESVSMTNRTITSVTANGNAATVLSSNVSNSMSALSNC